MCSSDLVFGDTLCELAGKDAKLFAITAAMEPGTGLTTYAKQFPQRYFDVGIAEGHAVSMAAGLAKQGMKPVFAVYSTFFQRSYDMLLHDISLLRLPVVFCVARAGLVGEDGETHHGLFDVAFLHTIPGMTVLCPSSHGELRWMLEWATHSAHGPIALRYPRGGEGSYTESQDVQKPERYLSRGESLTLVTYGTMVNTALRLQEALAEEGISVEIVKLNRITPLDGTLIAQSVQKTKHLMVLEEVIAMSCVGERIVTKLALEGISLNQVALCNCGEAVPQHGSTAELLQLCNLDLASLITKAKEVSGYGRKETTGRSHG